MDTGRQAQNRLFRALAHVLFYSDSIVRRGRGNVKKDIHRLYRMPFFSL